MKSAHGPLNIEKLKKEKPVSGEGKTPPAAEESSEKGFSEMPRRGFLAQAGCVVLGAAAVSPAVAAATSASMNPLRGLFKHSPKNQAGEGGAAETASPAGAKAYRVASQEQLPENGAPQKFSIIDDIMDGWMKKEAVPIGAVWVRRLRGKNFLAFQSLCPHAGCPIMYDAKDDQFYCPCHTALFKKDGQRIPPMDGKPSPSPRDMDSLEVEVTADGSVMVTFQRFKEGPKEKIAEG